MNFPLYYLTLNVTCRCNLRCKHCYNNVLDRGRVLDELSTSEVTRTISQATKLGLGAILFTGGEPLLRKDLLPLMKFAKSKKLDVFLATNGTLIDDNFIKKYRGIIDGINMSIDAGSSIKHDEIRGIRGSFEKTLKAIEALKKHYSVAIAFTASSTNLSEISSVAKIAKQYKVPLKIKRFIPMGKGSEDSELNLSKFDYDLLFKKIKSLQKKQKVSFSDPIWGSLNNKKISFYGGCLAGIHSLSVDFDGTIYPCTKLKIPIGNIRKSSLQKIWDRSRVLKKLRERNLGGKCGRCEKRFSCGGCRAAAYAETDDFLSEDPLCFL